MPEEQSQERIVVHLGNTDAKGGRQEDDGTVTPTHVPGERVTDVGFHVGTSVMEALRMVTDPNGIWNAQSWEPPAWVESTHPGLEAVLSEHYGCPTGRPQGWGTPAVAHKIEESTDED